MSAVSDIYDYFTPLEDAIRTVFEAAEVTCWTPLSDPAFQKERPRIEALILPGQNKGMLRPVPSVRTASGFLREKARRSQLVIRVVTEANIATHRSFVAKILYLLDTLGYEMNAGDKLPNHAVGSLICNGGNLDYSPEDGSYVSLLNCDLDFSVKEASWDTLT